MNVPTLVVFFAIQICVVLAKRPRKVDCRKMVEKINSMNLPWKADTYGHEVIDANRFGKELLGLRMDPNFKTSHSKGRLETYPNTTRRRDDVPELFTWTDSVTYGCRVDYIRDQSNCGSCWAVSAASAFSDRLCLHTLGRKKMFLSAEHIMSCDKNNYGCQGGYMEYLFDFLTKYGTVTGGEYESDEGCQPYTIQPCGRTTKMPCSSDLALTPKCRSNKCTNDWYPSKKEKNATKICGWKLMDGFTNPEEVQLEILENGPIVAGFYVYLDFFFYKKGVYRHQRGLQPVGAHAVKVVGWGIENGTKYWLAANSWGKEWGDGGYFKIERGIDEGFFESMMYTMKICD